MNKIMLPVIANLLRQMKQSFRLSFLSSVIASVAKQSLFLSSRRKPGSRLSFLRRQESRILYLIFLLCFTLPSFAFAQEKIPVFPTTPVEAYTVYGSLAILWLGIIWLIVIIKMKLNEIERIQKLGINEENSEAPILD